jgi:hypothetical protein
MEKVMKNSRVRKSVVIGALLVAGLGAAEAQAQTAYQGATAAPAASHAAAADSAPAVDSQNYQSPVIIQGGYNVGRSAVQNVAGCSGPTSLCNMYFGS